MSNRTTKPKTRKQNRTNAKNGELQSVSLKDLNDVNGGACSHAAGQQQQPQQQQPQRWIDLLRSGL